VSVSAPVTLEAAENEPMRSGRSAWRRSSRSSWAVSARLLASCPMTTTSAIDSRQGSSLEWCSKGPMKTTGRCAGGTAARPSRWSSSEGMCRPRMRSSLSIAPVDPEPVKITTCRSSAPTAAPTIRRASSRIMVVRWPVPDDSVWVLAYQGRTSSRMKSSMNSSDRPEAVWSA
jgi:hypothetical protein